ncbi:serine/threonine-protein phosphatase [Nocardiopsis sp. HNM0947]|uniref:Serine/threonine-protein phosphatase n=1 Tax=Nocardiopsis coralli TaxID=2772213 RepID=A0ABR9P9U7_9ACTN|nr:PP2C family protein-serine/threonine phosphatase [Nocardiopsis coralli]MBE3000602.1 serine/threonine-protein phosphatase [Nocardiopsis coralli]
MATDLSRIDSVVSTLARDSTYMTFEAIPSALADGAERAGLHGVRLYLGDRQQRTLNEVTGDSRGAGLDGERLRVDGTVAGLAFIQTRVVRVGWEPRFWVPIMNGSERLGVLYVHRADHLDEEPLYRLAAIAGLLVVDKRPSSDSYARLIRTRPMSVAAEMQWTLMPPNTFATDRVTLSATTEPAYDNAGDSFDYAVSGDIAHMALFDAMGHDNAAGLLANLTVGAFRNERRRGTELSELPAGVEEILTEDFVRSRFTTGIMAELDTASGEFRWVNCGHLPPVLLRKGDRVITLECEPTHPLGMNFGVPVTVCHAQLQPGDRVLMHTDGVTEARDSRGEEFGIDRFVDFIVRHEADGLPVPETLRRLVQAVLAHHDGQLEDDATVLFCEWHGR